ncbi:MAG: hypothetical protein DHS80DRAFT_11888 [Piptocephalis tieghemiana]|nr:MAG: hypothetical protein DHS80DRAFT_11888 [Piptocephalis tieghemiana]
MVSPKSSPFLGPRSSRAPRKYPVYPEDQAGSSSQSSARGGVGAEGLTDDRVNGLHDRVGMIRDIAIGLGDELQEQKRFLTEFDGDFDRTSTILDGTMRRFRTMAATQNGRITLLMILFVISSFTFMYFYVKFR